MRTGGIGRKRGHMKIGNNVGQRAQGQGQNRARLF
jgi:hypothetical protein